MKTHFEKSAGSRRAHCPETKSRPLGHPIWLAVLLAYLGLATVQAAPDIAAWAGKGSGPSDVTDWISIAQSENRI